MRASHVVCALMLVLAWPVARGQVPALDQSRPEAVAKAYLAALAKGDVAAAVACLDPATEGPGVAKIVEQMAGHEGPLEQRLTEVLLVPLCKEVTYVAGEFRQEGDTARQAVVATLALPQTLVLRKGPGGKWFVDVSASAKESTGGEPMLLREAKRTAAATCMGNLKQLALAVMMWSQDHKEVLPPAKGWGSELQPYLRNLDTCKCPSAEELECGYSYNLDVAGKRLAEIQRPSETVLFYESTLGTPDAADRGESEPRPGRHDGGSNRAFVDGHVQFLPATR